MNDHNFKQVIEVKSIKPVTYESEVNELERRENKVFLDGYFIV